MDSRNEDCVPIPYALLYFRLNNQCRRSDASHSIQAGVQHQQLRLMEVNANTHGTTTAGKHAQATAKQS